MRYVSLVRSLADLGLPFFFSFFCYWKNMSLEGELRASGIFVSGILGFYCMRGRTTEIKMKEGILYKIVEK